MRMPRSVLTSSWMFGGNGALERYILLSIYPSLLPYRLDGRSVSQLSKDKGAPKRLMILHDEDFQLLLMPYGVKCRSSFSYLFVYVNPPERYYLDEECM